MSTPWIITAVLAVLCAYQVGERRGFRRGMRVWRGEDS